MLHHEKSPVSRVREIRMHGLKGGLAHHFPSATTEKER